MSDDERIAPLSPREEVDARPSSDTEDDANDLESPSNSSAQRSVSHHRLKGKSLAAVVASCAAVLCLLVVGIGYGLELFSGSEPSSGAGSSVPVESQNESTSPNGEIQEDDDAADAGDGDEDAIVSSDDGDITQYDAVADSALTEESQDGDVLTEEVIVSTPGSGEQESFYSETYTSDGWQDEATSSGGDAPAIAGGAAGGSSERRSSASGSNAGSSQDMITVSVYADSSRVAIYGWDACLVSAEVTIAAGSSAYDALKATGVSVGGSSSYVSSIGGLAQRAYGSGSGWLYYINGTSPGISCGKYALAAGDDVTWIYTCDMGNDV